MSISPPDPLLALLLALLGLGLLDRLGLWMERRGWIYWRRRRARGSALGATFLNLQKIFESGKAEHLLALSRDEGTEGPESLAAKLTADHAEIDHLFRLASSALERGLAADAHRALDRLWMRLAVHIRAEHKVLFPALAAAGADWEADLRTLREDHDFFMATLAGAVRGMERPVVDWAAARAAVEAVRRRLDAHNALEEAQIYPALDRLPAEVRRRLSGEAARELAAVPPRYGE